jgi:hypothetical protein
MMRSWHPWLQLLMYQDRRPGFEFPADEWPAKLIKKEPL